MSERPPANSAGRRADHGGAEATAVIVWERGATTGSIDLRNESAREAIAAGWTPEEIARRVGVKPVDVRRWADAAVEPSR